MPLTDPVIIIGAGIVGLTLANGLKNASIPFQVYERDETTDSRGQGWAITLHWALPHLQGLLSPEIYKALENTQVDPEIGRKDNGNFLFLNLETLEVKFRIPPNVRRRVDRDKMRRALLQGVREHVYWKKSLLYIKPSGDHVMASFEDGSEVKGSMLVGAEGTNSQTRQYLCPGGYQNHQLPVCFIGTSVDMTREQVQPLQALDPLLFLGCHPTTGTFLWVSMLEVPQTNHDEDRFRVQINISWKFQSADDEVAKTKKGRLQQMRKKAEGFHPTLKRVIDSIPEDHETMEIKLADWPPTTPWNNHNGKVTLIGDAAHAMTMYRGEAANHGILDAHNLLSKLKAVHAGETSQAVALEEYETEMRERTGAAVLLSRDACIQAHDFHDLNADSALLRRRALK